MGEEKEARRERQNEGFGIVNMGLKEQLWRDSFLYKCFQGLSSEQNCGVTSPAITLHNNTQTLS